MPRECCEADLLIKPKKIIVDSWLKVQLKISDSNLDLDYYRFNIRREYTNMLILLVHLGDKKFWLFESNNTKMGSFAISKKKSKYESHRITNLNESVYFWYNKQIYNTTLEEGYTPQTVNCKLEYEFVKHRKNKINFIDFIDSEIDGLVYDFKIKNLKIQEKICTIEKNRTYVSLHKSAGHVNRKQKHQPYYKNDNDVYWFNDKNKKIFYVVPEKELIDREFISTVDLIGKTKLNLILEKHWLVNYEFDYDTINEEHNKNKLMALLNGLKD